VSDIAKDILKVDLSSTKKEESFLEKDDFRIKTLDEMEAEYQWCQDNSHIWYYDCVANHASSLKKKIDRLKGLQ